MPTIVPKKFVSQPISGLDVIQEAQALLKRICFGPDEPAYEQGESVSVFVDPERIPNTDQFSVFVTLYAHGHRSVDWPRCLLAVVPEGPDETIRYLEPLNERGQVAIAGLQGGNYKLSLSVAEENEEIEEPESHWQKYLLAAAAMVILAFAASFIWPGRVAAADVAHRTIDFFLGEASYYLKKYQAAWAELRFDEVIKPVVRVLPAEPGLNPNLVRVELSPRIEEGLVRDVSVRWGDGGEKWEPLYEAEGVIRNFQAIHEYVLPEKGRTTSLILTVAYTVSDAVSAARRFTPDELTATCRVEATSDGIHIVPGAGRPGPEIISAEQPLQINWASPQTGDQVSWQAKVVLSSPVTTPRITILVRPHPGSTFYVQSGARALSPNAPEQFSAQLGAAPRHEISKEFDILAVCSDSFIPKQSFLDISQIPHSSVAGRVTVTKAAGSIRLVGEAGQQMGKVRLQGDIWESNGGCLLVKRDSRFKVIETVAPLAAGGEFDKVVSISESERNGMYLLVYKEGAAALPVGQTITEVSQQLYWLYGPAK